MSKHCPTCGAADDGTVNGWVHRAQAAEAENERLKTTIATIRDSYFKPLEAANDRLRAKLAETDKFLLGERQCSHVWARRRDGRECADCGKREYK